MDEKEYKLNKQLLDSIEGRLPTDSPNIKIKKPFWSRLFNNILRIIKIKMDLAPFSNNDNEDQESYFNKNYYPEAALTRGCNQFFQSWVDLHHLIVGLVHISSQLGQHFILLSHFLAKIVILISDLLSDSMDLVQLLVLFFKHPLLLL